MEMGFEESLVRIALQVGQPIWSRSFGWGRGGPDMTWLVIWSGHFTKSPQVVIWSSKIYGGYHLIGGLEHVLFPQKKSWELNNHPNWRSLIMFQRGRLKPPSSWGLAYASKLLYSDQGLYSGTRSHFSEMLEKMTQFYSTVWWLKSFF